MATKVYKPKRKISATESEEIKIPASSVNGLSTVATSGSYNDLNNKPTIPSMPTNYVTTDTAQDITGIKSFYQQTKFKNGIQIGDSNRIYGASDSPVVDQFLPAKDGTFAMISDIPDTSKHGYTQLTNEDLNTITEAGWYNAASGNSCTNRPTNVGTSPFILEVEKCTSAEMRQTIYTRYWTNGFYIRTSTNSGSSWTSWQSQYTVDTGAQVFSGRKSFSGGINLTSSLQVGGSSGTAGQVLTSTGTGAPQWKTPTSGGGSSNVIVDRPMIQGVEYTVFDSGEYGSFIGTFSLETQDSSITITVGNADYIITNNDWVHCIITIDKNDDFVYSTIAINTGNVNRTRFFSTLPSGGAVKISTDLTSSYMEHSICVIMKEVI